jgi:virulence factor Mce-like protein
MRRNRGAIAANPTLVGAVTTLVVIVAVFLAYNANNGLPFVPTRDLKVELTSGSNLVKGNEVREGGFRVGVVSQIQPIALNGTATHIGSETTVDQPTVGALITLKLDKKVGALPVDSNVIIRPRSALGLKYVDLIRGQSSKTISDGGTLPVSQTNVPVQFDDVYRIFDKPTRAAGQADLLGFGNAFVGRGTSINQALTTLPSFLDKLQKVTANLSDPASQFGRFFTQLDRAAATIAPVAQVNSQLFTDMATTFAAFSASTKALEDTIAKSPSTEQVSTQSLHDQIPFLNDSVGFGRELTAATTELRGALPTVNSALDVGIKVTNQSVAQRLYPNLQGAMNALLNLAQAPTTNAALRGLTATVTTLNPTLRYLGPYVTVCNEFNYFWTFVAEQFSEGDPTGSAQRALLNSANHQTNSVGSTGAANPANGILASDPAKNEVPEYTHGQIYAAAVNNNGTADCEANQRGYPTRLAKYLPGNFLVAADPHTPYKDGMVAPVFKSFDDHTLPPSQRKLDVTQVPPGETFTRNPGGLGAQIP